MINIAIIEDETAATEKLLGYLDELSQKCGEEFHTVTFDNPLLFLTGYTPNYDLVLMDIELPGLDGMTASRKLRELDKEVALIFVTNMSQYAVEGYQVDARDYIVKPVPYYDFALKLERAIDRIKSRRGSSVRIQVDDAIKIVSTRDLLYVEVAGHSLVYHTTEGIYRSTGSLKAVEKTLPPEFVKCNNCYLVNLRYVTGLKSYTVTVGGDELQISHPKRKEFIRKLNNYLGETL